MDQLPTDITRGKWFYLRRQSASRVSTIITNFWNVRYQPNETLSQTLVRVTYDDQTNSIFVQAAPADMAEITAFIEQIDGPIATTFDPNAIDVKGINQARNDMKVIRLKSAVSDDLATLLINALTQLVYQGPLPSGALPGAGGVAGGAAAPAVGGPAAGGAKAGGTVTQIIGGGTTIKSASLRFIPEQRPGTPRPGEITAEVFEDVHIYSDTRTSSLLIIAQPKTMALIE